MKTSKTSIRLLAASLILSACNHHCAFAQMGETEPQQIQDGKGNTFMEEQSPQRGQLGSGMFAGDGDQSGSRKYSGNGGAGIPRRYGGGRNRTFPGTYSGNGSSQGIPIYDRSKQAIPRIYSHDEGPPRQNIDSTSGTFMEEVTPDAPRQNKQSVPLDLSNVGVQVDRQGNIIPLKKLGQGPVQQPYNSGIQAYQEMPVPTFNGAANGLGTTFVPVAPGTIPGIRSMNLPYGYYPAGTTPLAGPAIGLQPYGVGPYGFYGIPPYGAPYGYGYRPGLNLFLPSTRQYSFNYSQTSLTGPDSSMIMPLFQQGF